MDVTDSGREPVTVVVLTQDEEQLVERCVREASWADEVLVLDSGSADRTVEIARELGARVEHQPWLGWPGQRNAGAALASHDWVFFLECDEVLDHTLRRSVDEAMRSSPDPRDAFAVDRRDEFWGQLMRPAQRESKLLAKVRLYHRGHASWDESMLVHEEVVVSGCRRLLGGRLIHWRVQDVTQNAERVARYSRIEADALTARGAAPSAVKLVVIPVLRFIWLFGVKGYYRQGLRGYVVTVMRAHADFLRFAQHWGEHRTSAPSDPPEELVRR